jgi:NAD+ diphosphatase
MPPRSSTFDLTQTLCSIPLSEISGPAYLLLFSQDRICMKDDLFPFISSPLQGLGGTPCGVYFGVWNGVPCYFSDVLETAPEIIAWIDSLNGVWQPIRKTAEMLSNHTPVAWKILGTALEVRDWLEKTQFCGRCGAPLEFHPKEYARSCPRCKLVDYPRLSPAVIVAVVREDRGKKEILLAHNRRFPGPMHSVLAGFVSPGESAEETIARELFEEAGITVDSVRYFGSQCWPFPNSLMLGYTARYIGGDAHPDGIELDRVEWFSKDKMPPIPAKLSIARQLIDWFLAL